MYQLVINMSVSKIVFYANKISEFEFTLVEAAMGCSIQWVQYFWSRYSSTGVHSEEKQKSQLWHN